MGVRNPRERDHRVEREIDSLQRGFQHVIEFLFCAKRFRRGLVAHLDNRMIFHVRGWSIHRKRLAIANVRLAFSSRLGPPQLIYSWSARKSKTPQKGQIMRQLEKGAVLAVRAIGGLHVVTVAWDFVEGQEAKREGLLGF